MAVIKNHFETTISNEAILSTHTITGLTAADSSTSVNYFCQEASLYFLKSIYKTLSDAGYTDATMNEEDFSITVLGFKFFTFCGGASNAMYYLVPKIYTYGNEALFSYSTDHKYTINDGYNKNYNNISYSLIIRGDENCMQISFSSCRYPNSEMFLLFIAKAKNLITAEDAFLYFPYLLDNAASCYTYIRNKNDLYNTIKSNTYGTYNGALNIGGLPTYYRNNDLNTSQSKFVCEPVLGNYGTYLIYSLLKCNDVYFERGKYYKIGDDLYFCYGYKEGSATSYNGSYLLFKVS